MTTLRSRAGEHLRSPLTFRAAIFVMFVFVFAYILWDNYQDKADANARADRIAAHIEESRQAAEFSREQQRALDEAERTGETIVQYMAELNKNMRVISEVLASERRERERHLNDATAPAPNGRTAGRSNRRSSTATRRRIPTRLRDCYEPALRERSYDGGRTTLLETYLRRKC